MLSIVFLGVSTPLKNSHHRCSIKKMFLKISQNSQENTCARVSFLIKSDLGQLLLYIANQFTGVYMMGTMTLNGLKFQITFIIIIPRGGLDFRSFAVVFKINLDIILPFIIPRFHLIFFK